MGTINLKNDYSFSTEHGTNLYSLEKACLLGTFTLLTSNERINEKIQLEYEKNILKYQPLLKIDLLDTDNYFFAQPTEQAMHMKKLAAIYYYLEQDAKKEFILNLMKTGFKKYIDIHNEQGSLFSLVKFFERIKNRTSHESDIQNLFCFILYYKMLNHDYEIISDSFTKAILNNIAMILVRTEHNFFSKSDIKSAFTMYEKTIGSKIPKQQTIDDIINQLELHLRKIHSKEIKSLNVNDTEKYIYSKGLNRYLRPLISELILQGKDETNWLSKVIYTRENYQNFWYNFEFQKNAGRVQDQDFESLFASHLILHVMNYHYMKLTNIYKNETQNIPLKELKDALKNVRNNELKLNTDLQQIENERRQFKNKTALYENTIQELHQQIKATHTINEEYLKLKEEVILLRSTIFANSFLSSTITLPENIDLINQLKELNLKAVLFGGHEKLSKKLKTLFASFRHIEPDELNIDLSFVNSVDIVLFDTSYNSHANYNRFRAVLKNQNVIVHFINGRTSLNLITTDLLSLLEKNL